MTAPGPNETKNLHICHVFSTPHERTTFLFNHAPSHARPVIRFSRATRRSQNGRGLRRRRQTARGEPSQHSPVAATEASTRPAGETSKKQEDQRQSQKQWQISEKNTKPNSSSHHAVSYMLQKSQRANELMPTCAIKNIHVDVHSRRILQVYQ